MEMLILAATTAASLLALAFVVIMAVRVLRFPEGTERMQKISASIRQGANAYLRRQYKIVVVFFAVMFAILIVMAALDKLDWATPFAFVTGGFFSGLSGRTVVSFLFSGCVSVFTRFA